MYFSQGGTGVPCSPFSVFSAPFLSCLPNMPVVVGGGGRLYVCNWDVDGGGLVL